MQKGIDISTKLLTVYDCQTDRLPDSKLIQHNPQTNFVVSAYM
jgi:hypothetical protein